MAKKCLSHIDEKLFDKIDNYEVKLANILTEAEYGKVSQKYRTMFLGDIADHIKICNMLLSSYYKSAIKQIENLDTESFENLPSFILRWYENQMEE